MHCLRRNLPIQGTECPEIIVTTTDNSGITLCRTCPYGHALMATVRPQQADEQPDNPTTEVSTMHDKQTGTTPETLKRYTITDLSVISGVPRGCMTAAMKNIRAGNTTGNAGKILAVLASLGIGIDDLVRGKRGIKQGTKLSPGRTARANKNPQATPEASAASGLEGTADALARMAPEPMPEPEPGGLYTALRYIQGQLPAGVTLTINAL